MTPHVPGPDGPKQQNARPGRANGGCAATLRAQGPETIELLKATGENQEAWQFGDQ